MLKYIFSFAFALLITSAIAQPRTYSITNKKAIGILEEAQTNYERSNNVAALELVEKALKKEPNFIEAHILKGYIFMSYNKLPEAILSLEAAIKINPDFFPGISLDLGQMYFKAERYEEAKSILSNYISKYHPKEAQFKKADFLLKCAEFAIQSIANPVPFEPINLGPEVNSPQKDYLPVLSVDQNTLIFTRRIPDDRAYQGEQEDFYASFFENGKWSPAFNIGLPLNTELNEGAHALSPDGQNIFFTICELHGFYGKGRAGHGSCDLFVSTLVDGRWDRAHNLGPKINSQKHDAQPSMSSDGRTIYFSSARNGGYGKNDIYTSTLTKDGWSTPVNLGPTINTPGFEESVYIHPDNQTLYFTSDGHVGLGESDIFMSRRQPDGSWGTPINLGYPINTAGDEWGLTLDAIGNYAYFTSDREGGQGDWDIYKFKMPEHLKPNPVTYMTGLTYDAKTNKSLRAYFELIDLETGKKVVESESNGKGEFLVCLPTGKNYALNVSKGGYLFYSETFQLKQNPNFEPYHKDAPLQPIDLEGTVVLKNVFFDLDKFTLKPESKIELDKLIDFLTNNPTLKIEIGGHTDNQGSKEHNLELSANRAKAVMDFLIAGGIDGARLKSKGYADNVAIASNDNEEGRAKNRRTEFKIIGK